MVHNYMRVLLLLRNVHGDDDAHVSSPVPPSSSASSGDTAAGTSSTAVAVEDPTPVPSSSGDTAAGTSSAAVAAENPPPAPSASDVKIPEPAPGAPMPDLSHSSGTTVSNSGLAARNDAVASAKHNVILRLAREIRSTRRYVGYVVFVLLALLKRCRLFAWEGEDRIDLLQVFAPWAIERCETTAAVDAIITMYHGSQ